MGDKADPAEIAHEHDAHEHGHTHNHALGWTSVIIIALPIVLGVATAPQPLGAAALANRDVKLSMSESALPVGLRTREKAAIDKNIMDWWHDFRSSADAGQELIGQEARVTGFIFRSAEFGADHFLVMRFVVSCCVADANVLGLLVTVPDPTASGFTMLNDDQWVEVTGTFVASTADSWQMPVVVATQITSIDVPNQPYLYP
ncbi:MAG: TIGR03943 family protein [Caldilineaceae bacterium]